MHGQATVGGEAPHHLDDRDEVREATELCWEAGEGGRGRAALPRRRRVSVHQRHCSSFIYLYSWLLSAPCTEDENIVYSGKQPSYQSVSAGKWHQPREHPRGSSHCRCTQALSSLAKATTGLRESLKWRIQQIKPHKPQISGRLWPLSASTGHFSWPSHFALALLKAEHPLSHGGLVSAH